MSWTVPLRKKVLPAASAGTILEVASKSGEFRFERPTTRVHHCVDVFARLVWYNCAYFAVAREAELDSVFSCQCFVITVDKQFLLRHIHKRPSCVNSMQYYERLNAQVPNRR